MGKERAMRHEVPLERCVEQEWAYDFIEVTFRDKLELSFMKCKEESTEKNSCPQQDDTVVETGRNDQGISAYIELEGYEDKIVQLEDDIQLERKILIDHSDVLKRFLNSSIRILFIAIMSINIIWMQYLEFRYINAPFIKLIKWLMVTTAVCYMISWIKPYPLAFRKIRAHD